MGESAPSVFASNFFGMWSPQTQGGSVVFGPHADASLAPIVDADVAAVAARAFLDATSSDSVSR